MVTIPGERCMGDCGSTCNAKNDVPDAEKLRLTQLSSKAG